MAGDYTRFNFKPGNNYSGVLKQQGRVGLDSDANEAADIQDRRWRAESIDVIGPCVVPRTTDGPATDQLPFRITPTVVGDFTIGIGRAYVHGLLVENHGVHPDDVASREYDAVLGELRGIGEVPYTDQPYMHEVEDLVAGAATRYDLIYLETWQREVTAVEEPDLLEDALGGPDTATRRQTVWQVRAIKNVGDVICSDDVAKWTNLIAPSAGRLTADTVPSAPSEDPCIISAKGGYRGVENRLYRVEVHRGGPLGTAEFKWSRDNASLAAAVIAIEAIPGPPARTRLKLRTLGRDERMRFRKDDWVELLDEHVDFDDHVQFVGDAVQFEGSRVGQMAKIVDDPDEATQTVIIDRAILPFFDAADPEKFHTRLRRWDQTEATNTLVDGLVTVAAGPIPLEDGIEVSFEITAAGGEFKAGDYWVFAARTAEGTIDKLESAPPRGVLRHYCRLAIVRWGAAPGTQVLDCRQFWPPQVTASGESCCTVIVHPGDSIQDAIRALPSEGGCVCLKPGRHTIDAPIEILRPNVVLHGESAGSVVRANFASVMLRLSGADNAVVHTIRFERRDRGPDALVQVFSSHDVSIRNCQIAPDAGAEVGILARSSPGLQILDNTISSAVVGILAAGDMDLLRIRNNTLAGPGEGAGSHGIRFPENSLFHYEITGNRLQSFQTGVEVHGGLHSVIAGNDIRRSPFVVVAADTKAFAIDLAEGGGDCLVANNRVELRSPEHGGIRTGNTQARIENNDLHFTTPPRDGLRAVGISIGPGRSESVVRANRLQVDEAGMACDGIVVNRANATEVAANQIAGFGSGPLATGLGAAVTVQESSRVTVRNNVLRSALTGVSVLNGRDVRVVENQIADGSAGIVADTNHSLSVCGNRVENMVGPGISITSLTATTTLANNQCRFCCFQKPPAVVFAGTVRGELRIEACEVTDAGLDPKGNPVPAAVHGILVAGAISAQVLSNLVTYRNRTPPRDFLALEHRALRVEEGGGAQVLNNQFVGPGRLHLVELRFGQSGHVEFSNNVCEHLVGDNPGPTITFAAARNVVVGNHVRKSSGATDVMDFNKIGLVTLVGNMTSGKWINFAGLLTPNPLPFPPEDFNVVF